MKPRNNKDVPGEDIARHGQQRDFIEQGLAARDAARHANEYFDAKAVHTELHRMLAMRTLKTKS